MHNLYIILFISVLFLLILSINIVFGIVNKHKNKVLINLTILLSFLASTALIIGVYKHIYL